MTSRRAEQHGHSADWAGSDLDIVIRFVFSPVYEIGRCEDMSGSAFLEQMDLSGIAVPERLCLSAYDSPIRIGETANSSTIVSAGHGAQAASPHEYLCVRTRVTKSFTSPRNTN